MDWNLLCNASVDGFERDMSLCRWFLLRHCWARPALSHWQSLSWQEMVLLSQSHSLTETMYAWVTSRPKDTNSFPIRDLQDNRCCFERYQPFPKGKDRCSIVTYLGPNLMLNTIHHHRLSCDLCDGITEIYFLEWRAIPVQSSAHP